MSDIFFAFPAAELDKAVGAFLERGRKQHLTEESDTADGETRSDVECIDDEEDNGCQRPMLQHLRRLSEVLLKAHTAGATHLTPPEHHLQLLKALHRYLLQGGRDKVLHPDEEVRHACMPARVPFMTCYQLIFFACICTGYVPL